MEILPLLPVPLGIRPDREIQDILGAGGYMEITRDQLLYERVETLKLEVARWIVRPKYHTVEVPCSGSFGAVEKRRLATDFTFVAEVGWDAGQVARTQTVQPDDGPGYETFSPFLDDRLNGFPGLNFQVGILFALGEQRQYHALFPEQDQTERGCFYYCRRVQLDDLTIINSARGDDIILGVARGSGSAPLRRYFGSTWLAAGGFNFSEAAQKEFGEAEGVPGTL